MTSPALVYNIAKKNVAKQHRFGRLRFLYCNSSATMAGFHSRRMLAIRQEASANSYSKQGAAAVAQTFRKVGVTYTFFNACWNFSVIKCPVVC
jgi:hypothetical protein